MYYTLTQAAYDLRVNSRQLHRLLQISGIVPEMASDVVDYPSNDLRLQIIDGAALHTLTELHHAQQGHDIDLRSIVDGLVVRVAALEDAQRRIPPVRQVERIAMPLTPPHAPIVHVTVDQPEGAVATYPFAQLHSVPRWTIMEHITVGKISETTHEIPQRPGSVRHFLTLEQQHHAVAFWRSSYVNFQPCDHCPHEA